MLKLDLPRFGLTEWPHTQEEYWWTIKEYVGLRWKLNREIDQKKPNKPSDELEKEIGRINGLIDCLLDDLEKKYRVIPLEKMPDVDIAEELPPAPKRMIYYHDWYRKMETIVHTKEYHRTLCSVCPYSKGEEHYLQHGQNTICKITRYGYDFKHPGDCAVVAHKKMSFNELFVRIKDIFGHRRSDAMRRKYSRLKADFDAQAAFEKMLCSSCPYSTDWKDLKCGKVPCSRRRMFLGNLKELPPCPFAKDKESFVRLEKEIFNEHEPKFKAFLMKYNDITSV